MAQLSHILLLCLLFCQYSRSQDAISGQNLLVNGDFSAAINASIFKSLSCISYPATSIPGWKCLSACQLCQCLLLQNVLISNNMVFGQCQGFVIDLQSSTKNQVATQMIDLKAGKFQLIFSYNYPFVLAHKKIIQVYFNRLLIYKDQPQVVRKFKELTVEREILANEGLNNLTFTMEGSIDGVGFKIGKIEIKRKYYQRFENFVNGSLMNSGALGNILIFPGIRIMIGELINLFISFDRLQLYWFHNRRYSQFAQLLLQNVKSVKQIQGSLLKLVFSDFYPLKVNSFDDWLISLDYKADYLDLDLKKKFSQGSGILLINKQFLFYSIPVIFTTILTGRLFFNLLWRWPASKIFRRFSFFGIFLLMVTEGNVEQLTFYLFGEFRMLFVFKPMHKAITLILIFLFWIILCSGLGSFFYLKACYGKFLSYFSENYRRKIVGLLTISYDRGLTCLAFGVVHQLFLRSPIAQLLALGCIQLMWILMRCIGMGLGAYHCQKLMVWLGIFESMMRVIFNINCYLYKESNSAYLNHFLNDQIHFTQLVIFFAIWIIQLFMGLLSFIAQMKDSLFSLMKSKQKIMRQNSKSKIIKADLWK